jgi:hypothetical protein
MHRPTFDRQYIQQSSAGREIVPRSKVTDEEAFMILCMLAMVARFSTLPCFQNIPAPERGDVYAARAVALKDSIMKTLKEPSLEFVKGCVMLAYYYLVAGEISAGSVMTSVCVRFAYDLSLDEIDQDKVNTSPGVQEPDQNGDTWLAMEELRRLWWSIWELDTFVSTLFLQPFSIDRSETKVLLPAPDFNWICGVPVESAFINPQPATLCKDLLQSQNQSPRAWYLCANYLKSLIVTSCRRPGRSAAARTSVYSRASLEAALCNLKLSLPARFHLRSLFMDMDDYEQGNWVIATHLIIIASVEFALS